MNAIVLAAGAGRRLAPLGWDKPKCLLPFGQHTLLERIAQAARDVRTARLIIVVGYRRDLIEAALQACPLPVELVVNEDYSATNTICSLWLARRFLDDDTLYFNADVLFDRRLVPALVQRGPSTVAVAPGPCDAEDVKVQTDDKQRVRRIGKDLPIDQCLGEFVGVACFRRPLARALGDALRHRVERLGEKDQFFETALDNTLDQHRLYAADISDHPAIEIDTPEDHAQAQALYRSGLIDQ